MQTNREKKSFLFFVFFQNRENKSLERENKVENKWMMWTLMWLNRNVVTINAILQFLDILVVNLYGAQEQLLNEFQKKKKKPLFLSWSSKQKCMKYKKKKK